MEAPATLRKRNLWLTSDTHFCHDNIIQYCGRPFANAEFMNEYLIEQWNSVVKPGDIVYHLGDVTLGLNHRNEFPRLVPRLNGSKRLIVGNHDTSPLILAMVSIRCASSTTRYSPSLRSKGLTQASYPRA